MDWYENVLETIDLRSFSNMWYWIALAVTWSTASHWVLGVPFDMVGRARRNGGQAAQDLEDLVRINVNRIVMTVDDAGIWLAAIGPMILSALMWSGFRYGVELAQAVFLLAFPMSLVGLLALRAARQIQKGAISGPDLWRKLTRHRFWVQVIGLVSIFVTALWGMFQNMSYQALG
ncbi:component of SufBCD complex [Salipiger aestuarii]|uniref:Component of SufBCD complex n=1 Tax=Salipiger aestuarii TaxID=568098 RepID=A0A327YRT3_9RHOB|nr:hypothetical protein [Salipiger aestuarii]EIE50704.1 hypothetical protein C357_12739 [Citreicella sp. 357]KAA8605088.1 component of SufBCD complex [Salipiger aestuarii]KAA8613012.1 component of SufBCD complex [Salipiger aestuarii]KAB2543790.1 component of SufBCD complex [Salipiger aestuarii]RAK23046.1 hypothetical protein ATI53_1002226 [Salipiger aestuarii]